MEAAIAGILVFPLALGTKGKLGQGGAGAIVGQIVDNAVAGSAVGAVGEGIAVAAVVGIPQILETRATGGQVRQDKGRGIRSALGGANGEGFRQRDRLKDLGGEAIEAAVGGLVLGEPLQKLGQLAGVALDFNHYPLAGVTNPAPQI